jgi:hypothetical protein
MLTTARSLAPDPLAPVGGSRLRWPLTCIRYQYHRWDEASSWMRASGPQLSPCSLPGPTMWKCPSRAQPLGIMHAGLSDACGLHVVQQSALMEGMA